MHDFSIACEYNFGSLSVEKFCEGDNGKEQVDNAGEREGNGGEQGDNGG